MWISPLFDSNKKNFVMRNQIPPEASRTLAATGDQKPARIGLMGPFGWGNLGDAALQTAMISNVRKRFPACEIFGISLNPADTEARHGIKSFYMRRTAAAVSNNTPSPEPETVSSAREESPNRTDAIKVLVKRIPLLFGFLRWVRGIIQYCRIPIDELRFFRECCRALRDADVLICSGGGQIDDHWGGAWAQPYRLIRWGIAAKLARVDYLCLSLGVGSLKSMLSRFFFRRALSLMSYRSYRDAWSRDQIIKLGMRPPGEVFPDLAYSLPIPPEIEQRVQHAESEDRIVGINPLPYCDPRAWPDKDSHIYQDYVRKLSQIIVWLIEEGNLVVLFPTEENMDMLAIRDLEAAARMDLQANDQERLVVHPVKGVSNLLSQLAECDVVIASRFHGILLSHAIGTPAIGLSYQRKTISLMEDNEQAQYCFDIETFETENITMAYRDLMKNRKHALDTINRHVRKNRQALDNQYDSVLAPRIAS